MFYGNKSAPVSCPCNRVRETHTHTPVACGAWQELLTSQNVAPCWAQEMYSSLLAVYKSSICLPDLNHAQPRIIRMKLPKMPTYSHISITFPSFSNFMPLLVAGFFSVHLLPGRQALQVPLLPGPRLNVGSRPSFG